MIKSPFITKDLREDLPSFAMQDSHPNPKKDSSQLNKINSLNQ